VQEARKGSHSILGNNFNLSKWVARVSTVATELLAIVIHVAATSHAMCPFVVSAKYSVVQVSREPRRQHSGCNDRHGLGDRIIIVV